MIVAICIYRSRVSPLFDTTGKICVAEIRDGGLDSFFSVSLHGMSVFDKLRKLKSLDVDQLVVGTVSGTLRMLIEMSGITIRLNVSARVEDVIKEYVELSHTMLNDIEEK